MSLPRVLIIAGSDSSGGAGIQADIKTVSLLGGYAMTAITAVTAQNTQGVRSIHALPAEMVADQIAACLEDIGADAIKIGMLHDARLIETVAACLQQDVSIPVVLDPVMVATSGARLLDEEAIDALKSLLFPRASLLTPNVPEAEMLSGLGIDSADDFPVTALALQSLGANAVLMKGGHLSGETVRDMLLVDAQSAPDWFASPRIDRTDTHGTGCTLASAIALGLARHYPLAKAVEEARDYVHQAIQTAPGFGKGHGPLNHLHPLVGLTKF